VRCTRCLRAGQTVHRRVISFGISSRMFRSGFARLWPSAIPGLRRAGLWLLYSAAHFVRVSFELTQYFIPGRFTSAMDVYADTFGALIGSAAAVFWVAAERLNDPALNGVYVSDNPAAARRAGDATFGGRLFPSCSLLGLLVRQSAHRSQTLGPSQGKPHARPYHSATEPKGSRAAGGFSLKGWGVAWNLLDPTRRSEPRDYDS